MTIAAYRWVFDKGDNRNFQTQYDKFMGTSPNAALPPKRYSDISDLDRRSIKMCEDMSLSMFDSMESAEKNFYFWKEDRNYQKKAFEIFGKNIAFAQINQEDGVNNSIDAKGHFNHHPAENTDYENIFNVISCFTR